MIDDEQRAEDEPLEGEERDDGDTVPKVSYDVSSYGSDPEVEVLVSRLRRGDILIPPFQRDYVWRQPEASKFIESLLLGLPVPGIFLATELRTNKQLVIDGQQRLKTLRFFVEGYFNPRPEETRRRVFFLNKVQERFEGKTYNTLDEQDRIRLDTSIIHATIVKQTAPPDEDTSLYHIFERLNSGGRRLTNQEMRVALYHGALIEEIRNINNDDNWRNVFGKVHSRLKDQELILRFFAMLYDRDRYERPMGEFLNKYAGRNRHASKLQLDELSKIFRNTIGTFVNSLDERPFRITKSLNVAVFDSCMVGLASRLSNDGKQAPRPEAIREAYKNLIIDEDYLEKVSRSTADDAFVSRRMDMAIEAFSVC